MQIEQAVSALVKEISPLTSGEVCSLVNATGRILGDDITAGISVPSFPKSAMDGYAVLASDIEGASSEHPVKLQVLECIYAGDKVPAALLTMRSLEGCAVRIMTGAVVPEGFDTVVKQEDTDYGEDVVSIYKAQKPFVNYCKVGEDIAEGTLVLNKGTLIGRSEIGVLASLGVSEVKAVRKLRVAVISTGSEIIDVGQELGETQIYNSIAYTLTSALSKPSFEVCFSSVPDDEKAIVEAVKKAEETSDIIITTGGVSVGKKDLLPRVLETIGAKVVFAGVNVKPGSPTIGAVLNGKALLCLSGNPYAAVANFDLYMGHIIEAKTGCSAFVPVKERAVLYSEFGKPSNVRRLVRARVDSGRVKILNKNQMSSVLSSFIGANCYIDFPQGSMVNPGDEVDILRIPEALL